jgi:hypothetical protein
MRTLLALGAAGLIGFAGIGWYLGWYKFESTPTATGRHISIDLNTPKITEDVGKAKVKLRDTLSSDNPATSNALQPNNSQPTQTNNPVTPAGYQPTGDGGFVFPSNNPPFTPTAPSGTSPKLPMPR